MRKKIGVLVTIVLTLCLVGFAFGQFVPTGTVRAATQTHSVASSANLTEKETVPLARSTQFILFVVVGLECVLCGVFAFSPLFIDDPAQLLQEPTQSRI